MILYRKKSSIPVARQITYLEIHFCILSNYFVGQMADIGFHCFAPDWIGFGFSDKPQPGYGFIYTGLSGLTSFLFLSIIIN